MITYLTRASFLDTMADLDTDLLGQIVIEGTDLFMGSVYGTTEIVSSTDPAFKMWYGYEPALAAYVVAANAELVTRGVRCHHHLAIAQSIRELRQSEVAEFEKPAWCEDTDVLRSHRSNLIRRWPDEYRAKWKGTPPNMPYIWPFVDDNGGYGLFVSKPDQALLASGKRKLSPDIRKRIENL
jgi:hypothetical protein